MSLASGDLTTLAAAKAYVIPLPSDALLSGLITRISRMIQGCLNRPLLVPRSYVEQFNGSGTQSLVLPNYPVLSLSSLVVTGINVPVSPQVGSAALPTPQFGYRFQPWDGLPPGNPAVLELLGFSYLYGNQNVVASYRAGYQVTNEAHTVPATPFKVTPTTPYGSWATDEGVTYASSGVSLTPIPSGTPSVGQYVAPDPNAATPILAYQFASADAAAGVLLNYGFIPAEVEQVALELIAERAAYRQRVGLRSQSLAGQETISYETAGISKWALEALSSYVSVLPPAIGASV